MPAEKLSKKEATRHRILTVAFEFASRHGLESLTIGELAKLADMSKSGLFSHFQSKENLQIAVIEFSGQQFAERVIAPCREANHPTIEAKLRHLLDSWTNWNSAFQGQCLFLDAWREISPADDQVQHALKAITMRWLSYLHVQFEKGVENGEFRADIDCWQKVFEIYGIYLSSQLFRKLDLEDEQGQRFWHGVDQLFIDSRA